MAMLSVKYRPQVFGDVIGQDTIIQCLKNYLLESSYERPLFFNGFFGSGKTTLARIFARAILCENRVGGTDPCNECSNCKSFLRETNPDFQEIDAASNGDVESIRSLKDYCRYDAVNGGFKVILIDESHEITRAGNNALLKMLEEVPSHCVFLFCTSEPIKMLKTVKSRCIDFKMNKIDYLLISDLLGKICEAEKIPYEKKGLDLIAFHTSPHVRDAIRSIDHLNNYGTISETLVKEHLNIDSRLDYFKVLENLKTNTKESLTIVEKLLKKQDPVDVYNGLAEACSLSFKLKFGVSIGVFQDEVPVIKKIIEVLGDSLFHLGEHFLNNIKIIDNNQILIDIIVLSEKLKGSYVSPVAVVNSVEVPKEKKKESKKEVQPEMDIYEHMQETTHFANRKNKNRKKIISPTNKSEENVSSTKITEALSCLKKLKKDGLP